MLRELAKRQIELAASERNQRLYHDWLAHGSSRAASRPMIRIEINTFEHQILPALAKCEGEEARAIEAHMLRPMANFTLFEDDTLVPPYFQLNEHRYFIPFGLKPQRQMTAGLGHQFVPYMRVLEEDQHVLGCSDYGIDTSRAEELEQTLMELFGDILPIRRLTDAPGCCLMQDIVHIMSMEDMYVAMMEEETSFHAMMRRLTDDYVAYFRTLEASGCLRSNARMQHLAQGSYCFTDELTDDQPQAPLKSLWLYMDSQETAAISPHMYRDMVFPYYRDIMNLFGLVSYGCCEASDAIWDDCLSTVANLRKLSISPWSNEDIMGEKLRGTGITYLRKPPATILGMDTPVLDEEATLACFRKTARAAQGCKLEIAQRDVYQIGHSPEKVRRYVALARQALGQ